MAVLSRDRKIQEVFLCVRFDTFFAPVGNVKPIETESSGLCQWALRIAKSFGTSPAGNKLKRG
jgi:hypothetical protein